MYGSEKVKKLWKFFGPLSPDRSQSTPCLIFRVKQIHQSTASERTTRLPPVMLPPKKLTMTMIYSVLFMINPLTSVCRL